MKTQQEVNMKLSFKFYNEFTMPFDVTPQDTLVEVRQYLSEATSLFFYTNFHFEVAGKRVNEYQDIGQNNIVDGNVIQILLDEFDERSARFHVKKFHEGIQNPGLLQFVVQQRQQKPGEREEFPFNSNVQKSLFYEDDTAPLKQEKQKRTEKLEQVSQSQMLSTLQLSDVIKAQIIPSLLLDQLSLKGKNINFLSSLTYSGFNPATPNQRLKGDLFYLVIKTLENQEYHITASPLGYFINKSNSRIFDSDRNTLYSCYHSLIELMKDISVLFKKEYLQLLECKELNTQPVQIISCLKYNWQWLVREDQVQKQWDNSKNENWVLDLHGLDINTVRDWNEELQVFRDLPKLDLIQKINRDKALVKVHGDFVDAAIKGAIAVVDKIIQPLNPMDTELQQVYVYNHIFFSFAMETPDSFKQESGMDATPTVSTTNCDFRNLRLLHRIEIPDLHLLNAALVDYKGRRVIAQSIIPGILNSDHSNCTQYGSIDEGKTIQKQQPFHDIMTKVCEYFHLDDKIEFLDEKDDVFEMAAGIEVKGILGSDKRMYLLDLLRLSPRDLNYADDEIHQCCVLRPELIQNYYVSSAFEKLKNADEAKESLVKLQNILQGNDKSNLKLNPAISTNVRLKQSDKINEQRKELIKIAEYINKQAIPTLVQDLKQPDIQRLSDSAYLSDNNVIAISEIFHIHGVNMRYLGKVSKLIDVNDHPAVKLQIERTVLCKSLKHLFRQAMRETSQNYIAVTLAYLLNCFFGKTKDIAWLRQNQISFNNGSFQEIINTNENQDEKKKKKKKNKKLNGQTNKQSQSKQKSLITVQDPLFLKFKPDQIWNQMRHIAKSRYDFDFPEQQDQYSWLKFNFFKISCLRELCQMIGLKLLCLNYDIYEGSTEQVTSVDNLPFQPQHIAQIDPVVKCIEVQSDDERVNLELGQKFFVEGRLQESLECYLTAAQIIMNLYGTVHRDLAFCFSKLSAIYYKKMEYETAVQFQRQAVNINIHIYGLDHMSTATSLTSLSFYYYGMKKMRESFNYMLHALYLYNVIGGESHQEVFNQFTNLSLLYSEAGQHQAALNCLFEVLDRCQELYAQANKIQPQIQQSKSCLLKVAGYNQAIALEHSELGDIQKAVEFQTKAVSLLTQTFDPNDFRLRESMKLLENMIKALQDKKNKAILSQSSSDTTQKRAFGTNRKQQPQSKGNALK